MRKLFLLLALSAVSFINSGQQAESFVAENPLIRDGSLYTADPAPFVIGETLYVLTGIDEAPADTNDFIMPAWALLSTKEPASPRWQRQLPFVAPETVFQWAQPARAYAGQIIQGEDKRFYLFAPVVLKHKRFDDNFAIGVAVADKPEGPWKDAIGRPLVDQGIKGATDLQNIDPTIWLEDDGTPFMLWGTFGELHGVKLTKDMRAFSGEIQRLVGPKGFFEAPWLTKRKGVYYLFYAANNRRGGLESGCTPTLYHACIAWATADSPLGPWTFRNVLLRPVSSTTSHPGVVKFKGKWWLFYHTADGKNGGHFRRSVARDKIQWDDNQTPAVPSVVPTSQALTDSRRKGNLAYDASLNSSSPILIQYWLAAVNDGKVRQHPLPPELWASEGMSEEALVYLQYDFADPVVVSSVRFSLTGTPLAAFPVDWKLQVLQDNNWLTVTAGKATAADHWHASQFIPQTTSHVRLVFPEANTPAPLFVAVQEWELY